MTATAPVAVNNRTQVVGSSTAGAFVWEHGRTTILPGEIDGPGNSGAVATDINKRGVIAGYHPTPPTDVEPNAVIWKR
jgi:hypothetical protein